MGYDAGERAWDLIIKYSGSLDAAREISESVTELLNNYAVVRIREDRIEALASLPEVEFVEKPKSLYFQTDVGRQVSCIDAVQEAPYGLTGQGVLVGIVDSGIDLTNPDFRNEDGTTRIAALWDQADREYTSEEINEFLNAEGTGQPAAQPPPERGQQRTRDCRGRDRRGQTAGEAKDADIAERRRSRNWSL